MLNKIDDLKVCQDILVNIGLTLAAHKVGILTDVLAIATIRDQYLALKGAETEKAP